MFVISTFFTNFGAPYTTGSPSITIWTASAPITTVVNSAPMTNNGYGFYTYNFTATQGFTQGTYYNYLVTGDGNLSISDQYKWGSIFQDSPDRIYGTVVADGSNTTTTFHTNLISATTNIYVNSLICFTTGAQQYTSQQITGYNSSTNFLTVAPGLPLTPSSGDQFMIITF